MFIDNDDDERKKGMNNITHIYICEKREKKEKEEEKKKKKKRVTRLEIQQAAPFHLLKLNGLFCYTKTVQNASLNLSHKTLIVD